MVQYLVLIGDNYRFEAGDIVSDSLSYTTAVDLPGAELSIDVFSVIVSYVEGLTVLWSPSDYDGILTADGYWFGTSEDLSGDLTSVPYGTPVRFYADGNLLGKYYTKNIVRIGRDKYKVNAMSAIGFLEEQKHYGGLYSNETAADLIEEIISGTFNYSVDPAIATQLVVGWLPIASRRKNLHALMFALGFSLTKDENGDIAFVFLRDSAGIAVPNSRIFVGGQIDYSAPARTVEVTEHSYYAVPSLDAEEQLFDNTDSTIADHTLIEFSAPYYDLRTTGSLTIDDSGDNYAVISGVGVLTGRKYTHNTRTISRSLMLMSLSVQKSVSETEDTLVNALNSENVARRLLSYYSSKKTVGADLKVATEKSGDLISFDDPFGEQSKGIITQMEVSASSFLRAACNIVTDYVPTGQGNFYSRCDTISASGTWTAPQSGRIRVVLIGGAQGGTGGYDGTNGYGDSEMTHVTRYIDDDHPIDGAYLIANYYAGGKDIAGLGGQAGVGGSAGKILVFELNVTAGDVITFVIGTGGSGGAVNTSTPGSYGTATTATNAMFGTYTSDNGVVAKGYLEPISGDVVAAPGTSGVPGGNGGIATSTNSQGWSGDGASGSSVAESFGGAGGNGYQDIIQVYDYPEVDMHRFAGGGGGGGAALGTSGSNGSAATVYDRDVGYATYHILEGGSGGNGANAPVPEIPAYGCGGNGGHGGGGGGNGAGLRLETTNQEYRIPAVYSVVYSGTAGIGGTGSAGSKGGDGVAYVYSNFAS